MARDTPFDFSLPGPLRYCSIDPLGLYLVVLLVGRSAVYVHKRLSTSWESIGAQLLGHSGNALKATWAHPDHGPMFATNSEDTTIKVWEVGRDAKGKEAWRLQSTLTPHREKATDLQFLDDSQSLTLACGTVAGEVVIYSCEDRQSLQWRVTARFTVGSPVTAINWGPEGEERRMAVSDGKAGQSRLRIWHSSSPSWSAMAAAPGSTQPATCLAWSKPVGRKFCFLAVGYPSGRLEVFGFPADDISLSSETISLVEPGDGEPVIRLDWDQLGTYLSASWRSGRVDVFKRTLGRTWKTVANRR